MWVLNIHPSQPVMHMTDPEDATLYTRANAHICDMQTSLIATTLMKHHTLHAYYI